MSSVLSVAPLGATQFFNKVDTNRDDKITQSELAQAIQSDSVSISAGGQALSVQAIFQSLDTGNKGYITEQDVGSALRLAQRPGGTTAPPHGGGRAKAASAPVALIPDPADTNQDGTVSTEEELAYVLQQYQRSAAGGQSLALAYG